MRDIRRLDDASPPAAGLRGPVREKRSRVHAVLGLVMMSCVAPPLAAEIFKCTAKDGMPRYQNFPCEFDSIGWTPTPRAVANAPLPPATTSQPASVASSAVKWTQAPRPQIGMAPDELIALWGEPMEIVHEETTVGRVEIWHYDDNSSVQFDARNRIAALSR